MSSTALNEDIGRLLTVPQVAVIFGCHENSIYSWIQEGRIPSVRISRAVRVPEHALAAVIANGGPVK